MGGGYLGVELSQMFRCFGSAVTLIQRGPHLIPAEDTDVSEAVEAILREDGIDVILNNSVARVSGRSGQRLELSLSGSERTLRGSDLLVAVGRVPQTREVGLETAGVEVDPQGIIKVNDRLETTAPQT